MTDLRAIGYVRISKEEARDDSRAFSTSKQAGPAAQRHAIEEECARRDWQLVQVYEDIGVSGGIPWPERPNAARAIAALDAGQADILVAAKLDRLTRSMLDMAEILQRADRNGWKLAFLDFGLDTSTSTGAMVSHILAAVAEFERKRIGERTREALAEKKRQGVRIGRPRSCPDETIALIRTLRADGLLYREVADALEARGVPTANGAKRWTGNRVRCVLLAAPAIR